MTAKKLSLEELSMLLRTNREAMIGRQFTHVKSDTSYEVTGFSFNVATNEIDVLYAPVGNPDVTFNRDWEQFCDGRFVIAEGGAA